jgi:type VI secretion system protein ImpF
MEFGDQHGNHRSAKLTESNSIKWGICPIFFETAMSQSIRVKKSVFDRLLMDSSSQEGLLPVQSVEQLRDTVARDLEWLLNSRVGLGSALLDSGSGYACSVVGFGVSDFSNCLMSSKLDRDYIAHSISRSIEVHEPRLKDVRVGFHENAVVNGVLSFVIRAILVVNASREFVNFDAVLQPSASKYSVTSARFLSE